MQKEQNKNNTDNTMMLVGNLFRSDHLEDRGDGIITSR